MSRYFNPAENEWRVVNSNVALINSDKLLVDVTNGQVVVQLNPNPTIGETVEISHTQGDISSNPIIIDPLDNKIDNVAGIKIYQQAHIEIRFVFGGVDWECELGEDSLQTVTSRGFVTTNPIKIQNDTPSTSTTTGSLVVSGGVGISGNMHIAGDLQVHGRTLTSNSTVINVQNPSILLGGVSSSTVDDNKDRGIQFKWHNGVNPKLGFFGFDDSDGRFTFIPDAINSNDIFSGQIGEINANIRWNNVINQPNTLVGYGINTQYAEINNTNIFNANQIGNGHELINWSLRNITNKFYDHGTVGAGTIQFDYAESQRQRVQVYNAVQFQVINWPVTGEFAEIMIELVNGAAATITWPLINWVSPDGSVTNNFSHSGVALQLSGIDWVVLWTRNGGATIYGKVIR